MENEIDLFEYPELLPKEVTDILDTFTVNTYIECERVNKELNKIGYAFEYYLDAEPYNLHKIQ